MNRKMTSYSGKTVNAAVIKQARKRTAEIIALYLHSTVFTGISGVPVTATGKTSCWMENGIYKLLVHLQQTSNLSIHTNF